MAVVGDYAYVTDEDKGLQVIYIADPTDLQIVGHVDTDGKASGVAVAGDYAYVAASDAGLQVINIVNSSSPYKVGNVATDGTARGVAVVGDYAYVTDVGVLRVIDIVDPTKPQKVGNVTAADGGAYGVAVAGDYAYVADVRGGLAKINIATPSSPELVGQVDTDDSAYGVAVKGYYSYVADGDGGLKIMRNDDIPPEVQDIAKSAATNNTIIFNKTDFTSKYSDKDEDPLSKVKMLTLPNNGTLTLFKNPILVDQQIEAVHLDHLTFVPDLKWRGRTSFTWKGEDGFVYSSKAANVTILINTPPVVSTVKKESEEVGKNIEFATKDFTAAFSDADGDELTIVKILSLPPDNKGILKISEEHAEKDDTIAVGDLDHLTFYPSSTWKQAKDKISFNWNGCGDYGYSTQGAEVILEIKNIYPKIKDFSVAERIDHTIEFEKSDFTDVFSDENDDSLKEIKIVSLPKEGGQLMLGNKAVEEDQTIVVGDLDELSFEPQYNWDGKTSFGWQGYDGAAYSNTATVAIEIYSKGFCDKYWWVCYVIPTCVTAAGVTASVGIFAFKHYSKLKGLKAALTGDIELNDITAIDNPLVGEIV